MAERRMFSKTVTESDDFFDLSMEAQALYFHLCMNADDDGFVNNYKMVTRCVGVSNNIADELINSGYIHIFDSGLLLILHWKISNYIAKDRYRHTLYTDEMKLVKQDESKKYVVDS